MPQDHARRKSPEPNTVAGWVWFISGLMTGVFCMFLFFVWRDVPADPDVEVIADAPITNSSDPEPMQWDFYDIFPKSEVPIVEEYASDGTKRQVEQPVSFLLQVGSFRNPEDADRLRAELILLGMDVFIRTIENEGQQWHRVVVGPIDTETELNRHRRRLAEANLPSIPLRVPRG